MELPKRKPDFEKENLKLWFEEFVCHTRIMADGPFYPCYMVLSTTNKSLGLHTPKDATVYGFMAALSGIGPDKTIFFTDEINNVYWRYVAEKVLLEAANGKY